MKLSGNMLLDYHLDPGFCKQLINTETYIQTYSLNRFPEVVLFLLFSKV